MYRKDSEGWLKHADFIVLDMICLQLAFILAYAFRGYGFNVYGDILYRNMVIFLGFADLVNIINLRKKWKGICSQVPFIVLKYRQGCI